MGASATALRRVAQRQIIIFALCFVMLFGLVIGSKTAFAQSQPKIIPIRITASKLGIDLPILESEYNKSTGEWQIDNSNAHFANLSAELNSKTGATLIYAHNKAGLFANLSKLEPGETISIKATDNQTYTYKYINDTLVAPNNGYIFNYQGSYKLVLLSCYGQNSELRRLMFFELVQ
jgi:LPXTG-site transpeptidase (sortase) family protein